jgi:dTDP-4-dehydrorhamnose 3,5-epimerase
MNIVNLRLGGLKQITPKQFYDDRGFFFESYQLEKYHTYGIDAIFVQDNISFSKKGTIRGLHYQSNPGQAKLVSCLQGSIWDVAVDIRIDSPTLGQWEAVVLDEHEKKQLFIPVGFAHGFCVLSEEALIQYKVSSPYDPQAERSILWNDPDLAIAWPNLKPVLSDRDEKSPFFHQLFC